MAVKASTTPKAATKKSSSVQEYYYGTGKRKTSVARVRLYKNGKGDITINDQVGTEYLTPSSLINTVIVPLKLTSLTKKFDISVKVEGGGKVSQAEAVRHGVSRALLKYDESLRTTLKKAGLLTRDPRVKERKKPGLKKARRAPQFSKR